MHIFFLFGLLSLVQGKHLKGSAASKPVVEELMAGQTSSNISATSHRQHRTSL